MIDKETGIFIAKVISGIIALILLFTVIIPKFEQINDGFNNNLRSLIGLFFDTGSSFKKNSEKEENSYLINDFNQSKNNFIKQFLKIRTPEEIERTISLGNALLRMAQDEIEITRDVAFLYYMSEDYDKAIEYYEVVLESQPKRKRRFKYLKGANSRSVKSALAELAAVYYEQGEAAKMIGYYKQYLRAFQRDDVYREMMSQGIDERTARFQIFTAISGEGYLSYKKAIEQLEVYASEFPEDEDVFYYLGLYNYDLVNLFGLDDFKSVQGNFYDAGLYFYKILDQSDDFRKRTIMTNLEKLDKIKAKYDKDQVAKNRIKTNK